jgi:hypothetical protein
MPIAVCPLKCAGKLDLCHAPSRPRPLYLLWDGSIGVLANDKCTSCHGQVGVLSYATYASDLCGSMHGPVIFSGDPDHSKLIVKQSRGNHSGRRLPQKWRA